MPGMTLKVPKDSPLEKKILQELTTRINMSERAQSSQRGKWTKAEQVVAAYVPADADDAKRNAARDNGGVQSYSTIMIPYSYALLMAAHTYWTSVFFAREPVHQFEGRHGETENQIQALEAIIAYQVQVGGMLAPYYLWLYDAGKYGIGILGTYWCVEQGSWSRMETGSDGKSYYVTEPLMGYVGNKIYNVSPWDFLTDPRVPLWRFQEGEFVAVYRAMSWADIVVKNSQGYYTNVELLRKSSATSSRAPQSGEGFLERPTSVEELGTDESKHPSWIGAYEVYITLIPDEWGLGSMTMPEKWFFTINADRTVVLGAQPLGLLHNKYPFDVLTPEPEAYGLYNRGIPEITSGVQQTMDWLVNSHFYNVRAIANGRFIADPSRIDVRELESGEPGWIGFLRPNAWGTDVRTVFSQIQTTDATANNLNDFERMFGIGERAFGFSDQVLGALSGGRKTATEVRTAAGFGVNRLKTGSEYMSALGMAPHAQKLVQNTQQLMGGPMKVKIVGDLLQIAGPKFLEVNPQDIAGFYNFVPVDGTLPVDRFAQATLWKDLLGQMRAIPQLMAQFDMGKIFTWVAGLAGNKNLNQFRIQGPMPVQVMPDQMLEQAAQAGNVIQYPGGGSPGPGPQSNTANLPNTNVM